VASLSLGLHRGDWVLVVENDAGTEGSPVDGSAGLRGIAERVGTVGGSMDASRADALFRLTVRVPEGVTA
jgi:two-component system sensor histidine kinase DesK